MINYRGADLFCLFVMLLTSGLHTQGQSGSQPRSAAPESSAPRQASVATDEKRLRLVQTVELAFGAVPTSALIRARDYDCGKSLSQNRTPLGAMLFGRYVNSNALNGYLDRTGGTQFGY
jgi:hypothetical protein